MKTLKKIDVSSRGGDPESLLDPKTQAAFQSLVGGLGWTSMTRGDAQVTTSHLQSSASSATVADARSANELTDYLQKHECLNLYQKIPSHGTLSFSLMLLSNLQKRSKGSLKRKTCELNVVISSC